MLPAEGREAKVDETRKVKNRLGPTLKGHD